MIPFRMTGKQWRETNSRLIPSSSRVKRQKKEPAKKRTFRILVPKYPGSNETRVALIEAYTKGEARAIAKRNHELERLPVGAGRLA